MEITKVYIILYLSFAGQLREWMRRRFVLRTVESDSQLLFTNYHFVIVTNIRCANVNYNISFDRFLKYKIFKYFSDNNANWNDSFIVTLRSNCGAVYHSKVHWVCDTPAPAMDYEGAPWTRKGHRQIQIVRNDRGPLLLPLLEATSGYLHPDFLLSERRYCDSRVIVLNKK